MALQNRVTPFGELVATPGRGALMGNRGGRIHDPLTRTLTSRRWASKRWICCQLSFKDRKRTPWSQGYTELFFHDEASALARGHRPCFECRRHEARAYAEAVRRAFGLEQGPGVGWIDRQLHSQRLLDIAERPAVRAGGRSLPDASVIASGGRAFVMRAGRAYPWIGFGWKDQPVALDLLSDVRILTPALSLGALDAGYRPSLLIAPRA